MLFPVAYVGMFLHRNYKKSQHPDGTPGRSKVRQSDGSYIVFGKRFESPKQSMLQRLRRYMGGVIGEVLADERVNEHGLNFLDRMFRHP